MNKKKEVWEVKYYVSNGDVVLDWMPFKWYNPLHWLAKKRVVDETS